MSWLLRLPSVPKLIACAVIFAIGLLAGCGDGGDVKWAAGDLDADSADQGKVVKPIELNR